ncbi:MFS transporter [Microbacterium sp.]|uniref:MFS transporter n=1 Tax=Microbacterium sp. TaxID=51671 RepID=UPI00289E2BC2|nr:MFS transporter [Microbacterium sp.]
MHAVCVQLVSYGLRPAISYEILELGLDGSWLGIAATTFALPPLILALPSGRIVDRLGERGMLVAGGAVLFAAAVVALCFAESAGGLIVATALLGLGVLFSVVGEQSWVMRAAPSGRLDSAFGLYTFATSAGQMLGPFLLLLPSSSASPALSLVATATSALSLLAVGLAFGIRSATIDGGVDADRVEGAGIVALLRRPGVPSALITSSVVLTSLDIVIAYLPLLASERDFGAAWVSSFLVARGAATMLSRLCLGVLTRGVGRRAVLIAGGAMAGAALAVLALDVPPLLLVVGGALYGLAAGTVQPLTMSWMTLVTTPGQRGMAASLRLVGNRVGQTVIPLAVAGISTGAGAAGVFVVMGAALLVSAVLSRSAPNDPKGESG